jgi:hypothetical protein
VELACLLCATSRSARDDVFAVSQHDAPDRHLFIKQIVSRVTAKAYADLPSKQTEDHCRKGHPLRPFHKKPTEFRTAATPPQSSEPNVHFQAKPLPTVSRANTFAR